MYILHFYLKIKFISFSERNQRIGQNEYKMQVSVFLKEILNYSTIVSIIIIVSNDYKWPFYIKSYFEIASILGSISSKAFSIDCLLHDFQIEEAAIHIKVLIFVVLPFFLWFFLFLLIRIKRKHIDFNQLFTYFLIISNYFQPIILQNLLDNIRCKSLGEKTFLYKNMNLECDSENHLKWVILLNF